MNTLERAATRKWLDRETVQEVLNYDPETGIFTWRARDEEMFPNARAAKIWNSRYAGKPTGYLRRDGYLTTTFIGRRWLLHRLAWLYMTGEWPSGEVDHKDRVKSNNSWHNLREASPSQNQYNKIVPTPKSGYRGVSFHRQSGKWMARIKVAGRKMSLGYYDSAREAANAYDRAAQTYHGEFGVTNAT